MGIKKYKNKKQIVKKSKDQPLTPEPKKVVSVDTNSTSSNQEKVISSSATSTTLSLSTNTTPSSTATAAKTTPFNLHQLGSLKKKEQTIDYFGFPVKLIYIDLLKAILFALIVFALLFAISRFNLF